MMTWDHPLSCGTCAACGKQSYTSRATARKARDREHGSGNGMGVYPCGNYWHYGHRTVHMNRGEQPDTAHIRPNPVGAAQIHRMAAQTRRDDRAC